MLFRFLLSVMSPIQSAPLVSFPPPSSSSLSDMGLDLARYGRAFEDKMVEGFYKYGTWVGRYPAWFLWGPIIVTLAFLPGLFFLRINLDLYRLFVPLDAPVISFETINEIDLQVRYEFERTAEFNRIPLGDLETINRSVFDQKLSKDTAQIT